MAVEQYTVSLRGGLWEVWLGGRLIAGQPTEMGAVGLAEALSYAAAIRGEHSRLLVGGASDNGSAWARRLRSGDEEAPPERAKYSGSSMIAGAAKRSRRRLARLLRYVVSEAVDCAGQ
jgi:hypothetical protein